MQCIPEMGNPHDRYAVKIITAHGMMVGRMPRHLCNVVHVGMNIHQTVRNVACFYTGDFIIEPPVPGGGPQLKAVYLLEFEGTD